MITRRATLAAALALPAIARAQEEFPSRPIRLIIPFAPGGASDIVARIIQPALNQSFGRPVIIDNRPGATGNIGMEAAARAAPDGYTLVLGNAGSTVINPHVIQNPGWLPLRDLASVTLVAETPNIVVINSSLPVNSIRELVEYVRARPGQLNYGSAGSASQNRLEMEVFMREQGMDVLNVPYRGGAGPAVNGLMAGDVHMMFVTLPSVAAAIRGNRVRALAVTTAERFPGLPDIPTLKEQGYPQNVSSSWQGLYAPAATPPALVQRIRDGFARAVSDEGVRQRLIESGAVASVSESPAAFAQFTAAEFERWGRVVREIGVTPD